MKASELILKLEKLSDTHGDCEVEIPTYNDINYSVAKDARVYTYNLGTEYSCTVIMIDP
jgi:hypothetical protein